MDANGSTTNWHAGDEEMTDERLHELEMQWEMRDVFDARMAPPGTARMARAEATAERAEHGVQDLWAMIIIIAVVIVIVALMR